MISLVICLGFALFGALSSQAAPAFIPANEAYSSSLVTITNPPAFSTTTQKGVVFCGYGQKDKKLYFYEYNSANNTYKPILSKGEPISVTINSSGVFWKKIDFLSGYHKVVVYAEAGSKVQTVKREINVIGADLADKIKGFTVNVTGLVRKGI